MAFRSDLEAAQARANALEGKVAALQAENAELRGVDPASSSDAKVDPREQEQQMRRGLYVVLVLVMVSGGAGVAFAQFAGFKVVTILVALATIAIGLPLAVVRELLHICPPGFVLVLSGRANVRADGTRIGYRIVHPGRALRVPIVEVAQLLDCRPRKIKIQVANAYCKSGIPVKVAASASYKLGSCEPMVHNATERFLGHEASEADRVAQETLEGILRGVVSQLTEKELALDKEQFAQKVIAEAEQDMRRLGMEIDSLEISEVQPSG